MRLSLIYVLSWRKKPNERIRKKEDKKRMEDYLAIIKRHVGYLNQQKGISSGSVDVPTRETFLILILGRDVAGRLLAIVV
jgi:hypothetical protein